MISRPWAKTILLEHRTYIQGKEAIRSLNVRDVLDVYVTASWLIFTICGVCALQSDWLRARPSPKIFQHHLPSVVFWIWCRCLPVCLGHHFSFGSSFCDEHKTQRALLVKTEERRAVWLNRGKAGGPYISDHEITRNHPHCICHLQKSAESKPAIVIQRQPHVIMSTAVWCLGLSDADFVVLEGHRQVEGCNSHLLIVTGRGWTPARRRAVISLSSAARCYFCQNFNRPTKSILQGQIKKRSSKAKQNTVLSKALGCFTASATRIRWYFVLKLSRLSK